MCGCAFQGLDEFKKSSMTLFLFITKSKETSVFELLKVTAYVCINLVWMFTSVIDSVPWNLSYQTFYSFTGGLTAESIIFKKSLCQELEILRTEDLKGY